MMPLVAARVFNTPLMVHEGKACAIVRGLGDRLLGASDIDRSTFFVGPSGTHEMGVLGDPLSAMVPDHKALYRVGPVAVIPIEGTLVHKGAHIGKSSGVTSYEGLFRQVQAARADHSVRGVVFEIDSYGGEVSGAFDLAAVMHDLSTEKPTLAVLTDHAYSAAYLLASAARQIIVPESGGAGSIGVITMHVDYSKRLDAEGMAVTVISAGQHKADGHPYAPLPDTVRERLTAEVEAVRQMFAGAVGQYRGNRLSADAALATEATCLMGRDAVAAGLADATARPSEAMNAFVAEIEANRP